MKGVLHAEKVGHVGERTARRLANRMASAARQHVQPREPALWSRAVTHDALRALLPLYAAGELTELDAEAVRAHLASGCATCLDDVYSRPVGLPVPTGGPRPEPAVGRVRRRAVGTSRSPLAAVLAGLLALALMIVGGCLWLIAGLQARDAARARDVDRIAAQLGEVDARRAELGTRLEAIAGALDAARAESRAQTDAARAAADASAELARELDAAETRIATLTRGVHRRDAKIDRLLSGVDEDRTLRELVEAPGAELLQLRAVPPFVDGRGHVLWQPGRARILVYAFGLPRPPPATGYRLRVHLDGGQTIAGPIFVPDREGAAVVAVRLDANVARIADVEVLLEPGARAVLAGHPAG